MKQEILLSEGGGNLHQGLLVTRCEIITFLGSRSYLLIFILTGICGDFVTVAYPVCRPSALSVLGSTENIAGLYSAIFVKCGTG